MSESPRPNVTPALESTQHHNAAAAPARTASATAAHGPTRRSAAPLLPLKLGELSLDEEDAALLEVVGDEVPVDWTVVPKGVLVVFVGAEVSVEPALQRMVSVILQAK